MTAPTARRVWVADVAWMAGGACLNRGDLPWIADPEQTTVWDRATMAGVCQECPVLSACAGYAIRWKVTAGFWAGSHRDPDAPSRFPGRPGWAAETLPGLTGLGGAA